MLISCAGSRDGVVKVWSADANGVSGAAVAEMATHGSGVEHACLSGSGEATVSCGEDLALCAVREGGDVVLRLGDPESGERVSRRPFVRSFPSLGSSRPRRERSCFSVCRRLRCCDFDKTSRLVATGGDGGVLNVWDVKRRRVVRSIEDHARAGKG